MTKSFAGSLNDVPYCPKSTIKNDDQDFCRWPHSLINMPKSNDQK